MAAVATIRLDSSRPAPGRWRLGPAQGDVILQCDARALRSTLTTGNAVRESWDNPLDALTWMSRNAGEGQGAVSGRWVGYLAYDLGRIFEDLPVTAWDDLHLPLFAFVWTQDGAGDVAREPPRSSSEPRPTRVLTSTFTGAAYEQAVARVIEYIRAGDVFQVNLAQRLSVADAPSPTVIYQRLLDSAPASYGAFLDFEEFALICNSPELFFRVDLAESDGSRRITTRPIKGTRPRLPGMDAELFANAKDAAELNMIIDLERNDLGRICAVGSVDVIEPRTVEAHPSVYHGAASIAGRLRQEVTFVDILRAMFPGGSITGAPKIRAMQIIEELEPVRRGPYCGAIGWIDPAGAMEFNVAIRTMIAGGGLVQVPVGGGIIADSDPRAEYEETWVKASAMLNALGAAPRT